MRTGERLGGRIREKARRFSLNRAIDRYAAQFADWDWHQLAHILVCLIVATAILAGLRWPKLSEAREDGMTRSIYDAALIRRTYEVTEASFYEYPIVKETQVSQGRGPYFLYSQGTNGEIGFYYTHYSLSFDLLGRLMRKDPISAETAQAAEDIEYRPGSALQVGAYMYLTYTRYGVDCVGCSGRYSGIGNFGAGVHYDKNYGVRQWDGSYVQGLTYEGYYIIAADRALPYCTVLRIENHHWQGAGIVSGRPFEVIVLDRGSAITGNHIDLFVGLESAMQIGYGPWVTSHDTKATIVRFGKWSRNALGQYGCAL